MCPPAARTAAVCFAACRRGTSNSSPQTPHHSSRGGPYPANASSGTPLNVSSSSSSSSSPLPTRWPSRRMSASSSNASFAQSSPTAGSSLLAGFSLKNSSAPPHSIRFPPPATDHRDRVQTWTCAASSTLACGSTLLILLQRWRICWSEVCMFPSTLSIINSNRPAVSGLQKPSSM